MMLAVEVEHLVKTFSSPVISSGSWTKRFVQNFLKPRYTTVQAIRDISFSIKKGERVAFIGPNGAGKSTTIKILTGIMQPTSGTVRVLNQIPSRERKSLAFDIGAVFGHRSQLWYHLPAYESFHLLAAIYEIPPTQFKKRLNELVEKFEISSLLMKRVASLSLGERMRTEIVASLLHQPKILFLDEPTIGLDITAKAIIRDLIRNESIADQGTLLLTSHDTDDIEKVCDRVIIIDKGNILLDESLSNLKSQYIKKKVLTLVTEEPSIVWEEPGTKIIEHSPHHVKIEVDITKRKIEEIVSEVLKLATVKDLTIEGPPLEAIIQLLYKHGVRGSYN